MSEHHNRVAYDMICDGAATVSEVADLLGTSRQRVDHWCRHGFNPGRRPYHHPMFAPDGRAWEFVDAKAARKSWLAAEFKTRLAETPIGNERVPTRSARTVADHIMKKTKQGRKSKS